MSKLTTAAEIDNWMDEHAQILRKGTGGWQDLWKVLERFAENERLRQAFERVLAKAREDAKEYYTEGHRRAHREYFFPYDDFGVARDIINALRAALEEVK